MYKHGAVTILRWGLAFVFFYAAVAGLLRPQDWLGYLPEFVGRIVPINIALTVFSIYQLVLAALLFTGRKLRVVALVSLATFGVIVVFNIGTLDDVFRDVGLAMASLALFELVKKQPAEKDDELI